MSNRPERSYIYAGAARGMSGRAGGIFRRAVGDGHWEASGKGLPDGADVHAITLHPENPEVVYLGTQDGPYRSTDRGASWERLGFSEDGRQVWSILVHPRAPRILYLGTSPVAVYRSEDGGESWRRLAGAAQPERVKMAFATRVMRLAADPRRPNELYAGLEVGGVMRSPDGGERWADCSTDLLRLAELPHLKSRIGSDTDSEGMMDVHAVAVSETLPGTVFLALRMGLFRSADRGATWEDMQIGRFSPLTYARDVRVAPHDPRVLYACLSPAARSEDGSLYRSQDLGRTWTRFDHGVKARSTMMAVALHRRDPDQVYCATRHGQVFGTRDGGRTWHEFQLLDGVGDVYALACG
ncbi:MAG: WD40/YVTN/BNR-like repeat-containing protein [Candidatus Rokuibacteriota bacterium]